jgi:hypothetical protein
MTDTFQSRIPTLSLAELRQYVERPLDFKAEAVEAALAELHRRGLPVPEGELALIRQGLDHREATLRAEATAWFDRLLGPSAPMRRTRIRRATGALLGTGLGAATLLYLRAAPPAANPLGYDPMDTKRYLRDLELYGGKVNVLATQFMRWWEGLWQGRNLAYTVTGLTLLAALGFWFLATRHARRLDALEAADPLPQADPDR